jgi:uncharacterized protein (DUF1778 family)
LRARRTTFCLDEETSEMKEQASHRKRRNAADSRIPALAEAERRTVDAHASITLSERDRRAFFQALIDPPTLSQRLIRALKQHCRRIAP